jgi:hypothetical protein
VAFPRWTRLLNQIFRPLRRTPRRSSRLHARRYRLQVEQLETRYVLATTLTVGTNVDLTELAGNESEGTIAIDPTNPNHIFAASTWRWGMI